MINSDLCHSLLTRKTVPALGYHADLEFTRWKTEVGEKFISLTGLDLIAENACAPNFRIVEEKQKEGYKQLRFEFESEVGEIVPCYLLIPEQGKKKYPVAITMQGHSTGVHNSIGEPKNEEEKEYALGRGRFAVQAVQRGFIALAIEQRGMGERKPTREERGSDMNCRYASMTALHLGRTLIGERVWDISRAIDMLSRFPECDTEKILITGNSGGGTIAYYAACYDERIKISVPSCSFCSYKASILDILHCNCNYIPSAYRYFEMQDLSCLIAPRALAIVAGEKDDIFPIEGVKEGYETVRKIYARANGEENCRLVITPMHHWWCEEIVWNEIEAICNKLGW
ncbi:MAG: acetylxylan esterase [Clostridia bacterium]|nr:acetylxylan esterase [Clostridia bacterium]